MRIREVLNKHRQIQTNLTLKVRSGAVTSVDSFNLSEFWNICRRAVGDGFPFMSIIHCCEGGIFWYVHKNAVEIGLKLFCAADGSTGAVFLQWYVVRWERKQIEIFWYTPALLSKTFKSMFPHCWKIESRKKLCHPTSCFELTLWRPKQYWPLNFSILGGEGETDQKLAGLGIWFIWIPAQIQASAKDAKYVILKKVNFKT